jgi:putative zinc finger/helix-turn-helix YgiT family protein
MNCIECGKADLIQKRIALPGTIRNEEFTVEIDGLECPICGYRTIEGPEMPEYGRLLADQYRAKHGLLTSQDIKARRNRLNQTQEEFARHVGVGVASIKRWELGKIQDEESNSKIVNATAIPVSWRWIGAPLWSGSLPDPQPMNCATIEGSPIEITSSGFFTNSEDWNSERRV